MAIKMKWIQKRRRLHKKRRSPLFAATVLVTISVCDSRSGGGEGATGHHVNADRVHVSDVRIDILDFVEILNVLFAAGSDLLKNWRIFLTIVIFFFFFIE